MNGVLLEVKLLLKNRKSKFLMILACAILFLVVLLEQVNFKKDNWEISFNSNSGIYSIYDWTCTVPNADKEYCKSLLATIDINENYLEVLLSKDARAIGAYKFLMNVSSLSDKLKRHPEIAINAISDYQKALDIIEESKLYVDLFEDSGIYDFDFNELLKFSEFYLQITKNDLELILPHQITPASLIGIYFEILPFLSLICVLFFSFNTVSHDFENGTVKNYWTTSKGRQKYLFKKSLSNFIACCIILFVPLLVGVLLLTITQGVSSFIHPTLQYAKGITSFQPMQLFEMISPTKSNYDTVISMGLFSNHPRVLTETVADYRHIDLYQIMPLYLALFYSLIVNLLSIYFIIVLNMLFSLMNKNKILNLLVQIGLLIGGIALANNLSLTINNFNPYAMIYPLKLLNATVPITYLNGIVLLSVSSFVVYLLARIRIKRIDI